MSTIKKRELNELVGGDVFSAGNDRNVTNNSEIETGPVQKPYNDTSDYEKGMSTTGDKVFGRYRQNIPWFAVYSFGGSRSGGVQINYGLNESKKNIITKKTVEEKIEDLVKRKNFSDINPKNYDPKVGKLIDTINDVDLTDSQLEELSNVILNKKNNPNKTKNL